MATLRGDSLLLWGAMLLLSLLTMSPETSADSMVSGSVYCDQCKDGERSIFDYPLYGARVAVACTGANGATTMYQEDTTNWMGGYAMRFPGSPDLSRCYARVVAGPSVCGAAAGPAQGLSLMFSMFGMQMYVVGALLAQPQQPVAYCPRSSPQPPPPQVLPPPPSPGVPVLPPPPAAGSRDSPRSPIPYPQVSACSYDKWLMPEYRCHWRMVGPDTKVAVAFGPIAAGRYGTDISLSQALLGRGDTYRTLLREATAALLNSYNSLQFPYPTLTVIAHTNWALLGSPQQAVMTALRFKRANDGVSCNFSPCS